MLTYKQSLRVHFKRRFFQRFHMVSPDKDIDKAITKIKNGKLLKLFEDKDGNRSAYRAVIRQELVTVVYDMQAEELVTCLLPTMAVKRQYLGKRRIYEKRKNIRNR